MSNQELDSLFRKKLENLESQPSANAWDKISAQTSSKKPVWPLLRMAAAILILFITGFAVFNYMTTSEPEADHLVNQEQQNNDQIFTPEIEKPNNTVAQTQQGNDYIEVEKEEPVNTKQTPLLKNELKASQYIAKDKEQDSNKNEIQEAMEVELDVKPLETFAKNEKVNATPSSDNASTEQIANTGTTIVFNLEDFEKKEIESVTDDVAQAEEKPKGIKKVFNAVKELKNETSLGDLREVKNEILALNFKKDSD